MKIKKFFAQISTVLDELGNPTHQESFSENMKHLKIDDKSFADWMMTYLAWSELGSEEDCKRFYWYLEDEDEPKTEAS